MPHAHRFASSHTTALGVTQNDYMCDFQRCHSIFDRGGRTVVIAIGIIRRDKVCDISVDKELA
jgi:hypothetical protein